MPVQQGQYSCGDAASTPADVQGEAVQQSLRDDLHLHVEQVRTAAVYTIQAPLTPAALEEARQVLFTDAVVQESAWARRPAG